MKIEIYADGSDLSEMVNTYTTNKLVTGFTTNPSLMRKAKVQEYLPFVEQVVQRIPDLPVSFEVFADDLADMERQARVLARHGDNIFVKIPVTNTKGETTKTLIQALLRDRIKVNVTAVFTVEQIDELQEWVSGETPCIVSIFAGRIADTGVDPKPIVQHALKTLSPNVKVLWASSREVYNIYEADSIGCHIVTVTPDLISKLNLGRKSLTQYSLETVKMFYDDATKSGFTL
jgi:transaldolase